MTEAVPVAAELPIELRRQPAYVRFVASRMLSSMGYQGMAIATGWLVYDRTHNAFDLGLIGLLQFLPMVLLIFVAGHIADRYDRRRIGLAAQLVEAVATALLGLGIVFNMLPLPAVFAGITIIGIAQAFERPTMASLLPSIVPGSILPHAIATSTSFMQTAGVIGPALGGLLYGLGPAVPFLAAGVMFAIASWNVATIASVRHIPSRGPVSLKSVFAGIGFIRTRPVILGVISLDLFAVLLGGVVAMMPIFARDILHAGPIGLGLLRAAPAIGAIVMSLLLVRFPLRSRIGSKMLIAVAIFGISAVVFSLSTSIVLSVVALAILGASDTVSIVIRSSLVQLMTPDDMRGRVNAVNALFVGTSNQLGEFETGTMAGFFGPVTAGILGGVGTILVVILWAWIFPSLRRIDDFPRGAANRS